MKCRSLLALSTVAALAAVTSPLVRGQQAADTDAIGIQGLQSLLQQMAFDVTDRTSDTGELTGLQIAVNAQDAKWTIVVSLSPSKENFWLIVYLVQPPNGVIPDDIADKLLVASDALGGNFFAHEKTNNWLQLVRGLPDRGITPQLLRRELSQLADNAARQRSLWDSKSWGQ
jgi:hypothetical protein